LRSWQLGADQSRKPWAARLALWEVHGGFAPPLQPGDRSEIAICVREGLERIAKGERLRGVYGDPPPNRKDAALTKRYLIIIWDTGAARLASPSAPSRKSTQPATRRSQ
jgi:hypothetical protein